jgi:hypothetical protein
MSNYTVTTNFASKDTLISGNPLKLIKGVDFTTEFTNIATAITSKQDSAYTPPGTGAVSRTVSGKLAESVSLADFGCDLTGATDSTTKFQAAATYIGSIGGGVLLHPGGTVMINQTVKLSSNTILQGVGPASIIKANPTYIGVNGGGGGYAAQTCHMIGNVNFAAVALTDHDIGVRDIAFDWGAVTIAGGGAHSISMHFVDRIRVLNVSQTNGDNVTALISCRDQFTAYCSGLNCRNAYFDHWGGDLSPVVIGCVGRTTAGNTTSQGIQVTGQGSYGDTGAAGPAIFAFNQLYGIQVPGGTASALITNANAAGSTVGRLLTIGNYVEACDLGLVYQGATGGHVSNGDTFYKCKTGAPIFFNTDASGAPANCRIVNPTLIDCNHLPGNIAMVVIQGTNNRVEGINVQSPGGVLYTDIVWFPAAATNCYVSIDKAPSGITGLRINNQSATSLIKDADDLDAWPYNGALPTVAAAATITPTLGTTFVNGATSISTITVPNGCQQGGTIQLIPTGGSTWNTLATGNIATATTVIAGRVLQMTYIANLGKWYPSYV